MNNQRKLSNKECLVCCNPLSYYTVVDCTHSGRICGFCTLKLLSQQSKNDEESHCLYCKQVWDHILISESMHISNPFHKDKLSKYYRDKRIRNVFYDNNMIQQQFMSIRTIVCHICDNKWWESCSNMMYDSISSSTPIKYSRNYQSFEHLASHLKSKHKRYLCTACWSSRTVFPFQHATYTSAGLTVHFEKGSPGGVNEAPSNPHPFCKFCNIPFFGTDELFVHCTTKHRLCRFCYDDDNQQFFENDIKLLGHYRKRHRVCEECLPVVSKHAETPAEFVVFRNSDDISYRQHMLKFHVDTSKLSRSQLKEMRKINVQFDYDRYSSQQHQHQPRGRRRRGRNQQQHQSIIILDESTPPPPPPQQQQQQPPRQTTKTVVEEKNTIPEYCDDHVKMARIKVIWDLVKTRLERVDSVHIVQDIQRLKHILKDVQQGRLTSKRFMVQFCQILRWKPDPTVVYNMNDIESPYRILWLMISLIESTDLRYGIVDAYNHFHLSNGLSSSSMPPGLALAIDEQFPSINGATAVATSSSSLQSTTQQPPPPPPPQPKWSVKPQEKPPSKTDDFPQLKAVHAQKSTTKHMTIVEMVEHLSIIRSEPQYNGPLFNQLYPQLQLLILIQQHVIDAIIERYGELYCDATSRYYLVRGKIQDLQRFIKSIRGMNVIEFDRLGKFGLQSNASTMISNVCQLYMEHKNDGVVHDWLARAVETMTPQDLWILLEYIHTVFLHVTSNTYMNDLKQQQHEREFTSSIPTQLYNDMNVSILHNNKDDIYDHDDIFELNKKQQPNNNNSKGKNNKQKRKKKKQILLKWG